MNYYNTWKSTKPLLALAPVIIFWVTSVIFFIVGLSFKNPIVLFGTDLTSYIAISLSLANTAIQIIGNDTEDLDLQLKVIWLASYVLGIGTNIYGLLQVLSIQNPFIEWSVAISLGSIIEISPEKLFVQFLRGLRNYNKPKEITQSKNTHFKPQSHQQSHQHNNSFKQNKPIQKTSTPPVMTGADFMKLMEERNGNNNHSNDSVASRYNNINDK